MNSYEKVLVVANGEPPSSHLFRRLMGNHSCLVAVDGGIHFCLHENYEPQLLLGDFDSITENQRKEWAHIKQLHTPDQNQSDLEKALSYLFESGAKEITVCGALGKRLDHTLANICLLARYPGKVKCETDTEICFALPPHSRLSCRIGQILSLIPISTSVTNIKTIGLKWELSGQSFSKDFVGISNICLQKEIFISFETGDLIACLVHPQ